MTDISRAEILTLLLKWGKLLSKEEKAQIVRIWLKKDKNGAKIFDTWILAALEGCVKEAQESQRKNEDFSEANR